MLRLQALIKPKPIPGSYEPFRSTAGDAVNQQFPFLEEEREATPLGKLEEVVARACKGNQALLDMNLTVARATHEFATSVSLSAERADIRPITLSFGHAYQFGMPLIMRYNGAAHAAFPDLRRTTPLSAVGCRVVLSLMHQRWRVNYPDLAELRLVIWRYLNNAKRTVREVTLLDSALIPYDDLLADIAETYQILHGIMSDQEDRRRRSGGGAGPLFGT
jgi:hypothetical protein